MRRTCFKDMAVSPAHKETIMSTLNSDIDTKSKDFAANTKAMDALVDTLNTQTAKAALGGPERSRERHVGRGKLLPRQRVRVVTSLGMP